MKRLLCLIGVQIIILVLITTAHAAGDNLAYLYGTASQSSTYPYYNPRASLAIDGNTNGDFYSGSVTLTNYENAWWQVDLGSEYALDSIMIWNRTDGSMGRLSDFHVSVMDDYMNEVWGQDYFTDGGYPDPVLEILLPSLTSGQFIKIQLNTPNFLSLAEVQVYEAAVAPEPVSSTLFLIGGATLGFRRFRKKRKDL